MSRTPRPSREEPTQASEATAPGVDDVQLGEGFGHPAVVLTGAIPKKPLDPVEGLAIDALVKTFNRWVLTGMSEPVQGTAVLSSRKTLATGISDI
ncbi:MAG: hypothetical protein ACK5UW_07395 [bacterium]